MLFGVYSMACKLFKGQQDSRFLKTQSNGFGKLLKARLKAFYIGWCLNDVGQG